MADETATLKDTVVSDAPATTPVAVATPADKIPEVPRIVEAPSPEAAELGQILLNSGYSKEQLNDLLESPRALASLRDMFQNNPQEFINSLFRSDPQVGEKFLEVAGEEYVRRYDKPKPGKPSGDSKVSDDLMREVELLREKTARLETREEQRANAAAVAQAKARFEGRVDDLFNLKEVQELGLSKSEQKNMRARLSTELSQDQSAVQRISNGNFVDVPKTFQGLLQEKVDERKALADADQTKRERSKLGAFAEFPSGPNPFMVPDSSAEIFNSWEGTEDGFAKALEGLR